MITGCRISTNLYILRNRHQSRECRSGAGKKWVRWAGRAGKNPVGVIGAHPCTGALPAASSGQNKTLTTLICRAGHSWQQKTEPREGLEIPNRCATCLAVSCQIALPPPWTKHLTCLLLIWFFFYLLVSNLNMKQYIRKKYSPNNKRLLSSLISQSRGWEQQATAGFTFYPRYNKSCRHGHRIVGLYYCPHRVGHYYGFCITGHVSVERFHFFSWGILTKHLLQLSHQLL